MRTTAQSIGIDPTDSFEPPTMALDSLDTETLLRGWGENGIYRAALENLLSVPRQGPHDDTVRVLRSWLELSK